MPPIDIFRKMGIALDRVQQSVTATLSAHDTGAHLEVLVGRPLLVLNRSTYDDKGQLIDHMYVLYRPDQYQFEMQFSMK
jgi:GntR family transcriptional regulator